MSSAGQDQWIASKFPRDYAGWGIDVGAADGRILSNTYALEAAGWNILCVEAMYSNARELRRIRRNFMICAIDYRPQEWGEFFINPNNPTAYSSLRPADLFAPQTTAKTRVPVLTMNQVLCISGFPQLDLVSIDIEGTELDALKGLDIARWRPKVIIAECWPHTDAGDKMDAYLSPFGYKYDITLEQDRGYVYIPPTEPVDA